MSNNQIHLTLAVRGENVSILKNAIDSIAIGLEDYESTDERRIVSSTRNIFAGILLLFKHKLCELSPTRKMGNSLAL